MQPELNIVFQFREQTQDKSYSKLVMEYYELLDSIQEYKRQGDSEKVFIYSLASLPLIEPLIKDCNRKYGQFDVIKIPAFDEIIDHYVKNDIRGQLLNLRDIVCYFHELEPWRDKVIDALGKIPEY